MVRLAAALSPYLDTNVKLNTLYTSGSVLQRRSSILQANISLEARRMVIY